MNSAFFGLIPFQQALVEEERAYKRAALNGQGTLLGFESGPVITLGVRGNAANDLTLPETTLNERGFEVFHLKRGGQATLHNPGQLVIFPIFKLAPLGVKAWIDILAEVSRDTLSHFGIDSRWDECKPGLYTPQGKIVALGLRIRQGISTHGLAINVSNRLEDFSYIRPCGESQVQLDRFPQAVALTDVFAEWVRRFEARVSQL